MKSTRVNPSGHVLLYRPDYINSYPQGNYKGYVYEHRFMMEIHLGRSLTEDEIVHHLNMDPSDNRFENLLLISRGSHIKLHLWLNSGAPGYENTREKGMNSGKPNLQNTDVNKRCKHCDITLSIHQTNFCSNDCYTNFLRNTSKRPSLEVLKDDFTK